MPSAVVESDGVLSPGRLVLVARTKASPFWARRVLLVGTGALGRATAEDLEARYGRGCVVGFLAWEGDDASHPLSGPLLGPWHQLGACLVRYAVHEVYLAATAKHHGDALEALVAICERMDMPFAVPAVPFRLTRGQARGTRGFADGYIHFQVPSRPWPATMLHAVRLASARAVAFCAMLPIPRLHG